MVDRDLVAEERAAARQAAGSDAGRRSGMDAGTRRLALIAGGIGTLLVATVGGWSLLGHRPGGGIPLIAPPPGPVRVRPADPGGMQLMPGQVAQVNGPAAQALAPGPEAAAPQALQAEVEAARKADAPAAAPTKTAVPAGAGPVPSPPGPTQAVPAQAQARTRVEAPATDADPIETAPTEAIPAAPAAPAPPPAAASGPAVQLAALDSEQAARAEWSRLVRQAPALLGGRTPTILHVSRNGRQFYRLRTGGFASAAEAGAFCSRARALGIACARADF